MRVAIVSCLLPPNVRSGGTEVPLRQAHALRDAGHEVFLFTGRDEPSVPDLTRQFETVDEFITWHVVTTESLHFSADRFFANPAIEPYFAEFLASMQPDVIHFHCLQGLGMTLIPIARSSGATVVLQIHDFWWWCNQQFLISDSGLPCTGWGSANCTCADAVGLPHESVAERAVVLGMAHAVLVPCETTARWVETLGTYETPIFVGGQPTLTLPQCPRTDRRENEPFVVAYFGGVGSEKGWLELLDAAKMLLERLGGDVFRFECAGVPKQSVPHELRRVIRARAKQDRQGVARMVSESDVVVVPSVAAETFNFVAREVLFFGRPVIITDGPGGVDLSRGTDDVVIIPRGSGEHLAAAINEFRLVGRVGRPVHYAPVTVDLADDLEQVYARAAGGDYVDRVQ